MFACTMITKQNIKERNTMKSKSFKVNTNIYMNILK